MPRPAIHPQATTTATPHRRVDAMQILSREQMALRRHFRDYRRLVLGSADLEQKAAVAGRICDACCLHLQLKEELLHPAARSVLDGDTLLNQLRNKHAQSLALIARLDEMEPQDRDFDAAVAMLEAQLLPHFDEEQATLFPRLCRSALDLESLGRQLAARRRELQSDVSQRSMQATGS